MLSQLRFQDHEGFQRAALYWTVGGAGGAMLALFGRSLLGFGESAGPLTLLAGVGLGVGAAVGRWTRSWGAWRWARRWAWAWAW